MNKDNLAFELKSYFGCNNKNLDMGKVLNQGNKREDIELHTNKLILKSKKRTMQSNEHVNVNSELESSILNYRNFYARM